VGRTDRRIDEVNDLTPLRWQQMGDTAQSRTLGVLQEPTHPARIPSAPG